MSNTSKGPGEKGSKKWIQHFVNTEDVVILTNKIQMEDHSISGLKWCSPLKKESYDEYRTGNIPHMNSGDITFWPSQGPWWDAVATFDNEGILLVEAKAHLSEINSKCRASNPDSVNKIKFAMQRTHKALVPAKSYDENTWFSNDEKTWFSKYYQLANRLTFLHHLKEQGNNVRLLLLNFVNDWTHICTDEKEWRNRSEIVWKEMIGTSQVPQGVLEILLEVKPKQ